VQSAALRERAVQVVDDVRADRREAAIALAARLGVRLRQVVRSKRKTSALASRKVRPRRRPPLRPRAARCVSATAAQGECNAMNTGLILARAPAVVFLNDFTCVPSPAPTPRPPYRPDAHLSPAAYKPDAHPPTNCPPPPYSCP